MAVTDNQIALLRHAAADSQGLLEIEIPSAAIADGAARTVDDLVALGYLEQAGEERRAGGGAIIRRLRITAEGRAALGGGPADRSMP